MQTITRLAEEMSEETGHLVRGAIARREPVVAKYRGHRLILCPHVLGQRQGARQVLALLVNTTPPFQWAWIPLDEVKHATVGEGPWFTTPPESWPGREDLDEVEATVEPLAQSESGRTRNRKLMSSQGGGDRLGITVGHLSDQGDLA